ncbi:hypothetical protein JYU34_013037 [Plutella xylostella]|uniref:Uncharacterized protein n=1 Tax=Plutella xylostella TaxID=51655 RepID=A0ABQ7QCS6_PLUXY|nr:hypothetical protein JYU34_013037 [Plutella xylostella]
MFTFRAHWSQNPFWADEDIFASSSTNPASNQKKEKKKEPAKRGKASSKSSAPPPAASVAPRDLFACGSDTEPEEPIPATQPSAVKRKRAVFPDSEVINKTFIFFIWYEAFYKTLAKFHQNRFSHL